MRELTTFFDGTPLADSIVVEAGETGALGNSHFYRATIKGEIVARVQFQEGSRKLETSLKGITESVLLAILIDRLSNEQGDYRASDNGLVVGKCIEALDLLKSRVTGRRTRRTKE